MCKLCRLSGHKSFHLYCYMQRNDRNHSLEVARRHHFELIVFSVSSAQSVAQLVNAHAYCTLKEMVVILPRGSE